MTIQYAATSRKVVGKNVHATIPKGNMGYHQYTVPDTTVTAVEPTFVALLLALAKIRPWPLVPFSPIFLKNSALKTTHNTFRDRRVHFFRQPFSKYRKIPKISPGAYFFKGPFWGVIFVGAYLRTEICLYKSIGLALQFEGNLPFLFCFTLYLRAIFQVQAPGGLIFGGAI